MKKDTTKPKNEETETLFNQHRLLTEKARELLEVCKDNDSLKLQNKTHHWVTLSDGKTMVLRKIKPS